MPTEATADADNASDREAPCRSKFASHVHCLCAHPLVEVTCMIRSRTKCMGRGNMQPLLAHVSASCGVVQEMLMSVASGDMGSAGRQKPFPQVRSDSHYVSQEAPTPCKRCQLRVLTLLTLLYMMLRFAQAHRRQGAVAGTAFHHGGLPMMLGTPPSCNLAHVLSKQVWASFHSLVHAGQSCVWYSWRSAAQHYTCICRAEADPWR